MEHKANKNSINQIDYVDYISRNATFLETNVYSKYDTWREIIVQTKISDSEGVGYVFRKNAKDDYVLLNEFFVGEIENVYAITNKINATMNGTFDTQYPPNYFTKTINSTIECKFIGSRIDFNTYTNNQGGLWEFILNEGAVGEMRKEISIYTANANANAVFTLFENLETKMHTLKGVFKGQDPNNPVADSRGWLYFGGVRPQDTKSTFYIYNNTFKVIRSLNDGLLYSYSNKDYAINLRKLGNSGGFNWIPEHNAIGTAFKVDDAKLIINGKEVIQGNEIFFTDVKDVLISQHIQGKMPYDLNTPLLDVISNIKLENGKVQVSGKIKFLEDCEVTNGYTIMTPYYRNFAQKIKSSFKNTYTCKDSGNEYIKEQGDSISYVIFNETDEKLKNYVVGVRFNSIHETNRQGQDGLPTDIAWIENRSATMGKLYIRQYSDCVIKKGYTHYFDGTYIIGKITNISDYLL